MWTAFRELLGELWHDDSGTVVIEYAMLAMTVAMAIVGVVHLTADRLGEMLMDTANKFAQ